MAVSEWCRELASVDLAVHAAAYGRRGWPVVPLWWCADAQVCACPEAGHCHSPGKHPLISEWQRNASTDLEIIGGWWQRWPFANIGLATGATAGMFVLDVDGDDGQRSLHAMFKKHGRPPPTNVATTGGGRHIFFKHPGRTVRNKVRVAPGLDLRGDGGYVVAAPSLHSSGVRYEWHPAGHPSKVRPCDSPTWALAMLAEQSHEKRRGNFDKNKPKPRIDVDTVDTLPEGGRNRGLFALGARMRWEGRDDGEVLEMLGRINQAACSPPLSDKEVAQIVKSVCKLQQESPT